MSRLHLDIASHRQQCVHTADRANSPTSTSWRWSQLVTAWGTRSMESDFEVSSRVAQFSPPPAPTRCDHRLARCVGNSMDRAQYLSNVERIQNVGSKSNPVQSAIRCRVSLEACDDRLGVFSVSVPQSRLVNPLSPLLSRSSSKLAI